MTGEQGEKEEERRKDDDCNDPYSFRYSGLIRLMLQVSEIESVSPLVLLLLACSGLDSFDAQSVHARDKTVYAARLSFLFALSLDDNS